MQRQLLCCYSARNSSNNGYRLVFHVVSMFGSSVIHLRPGLLPVGDLAFHLRMPVRSLLSQRFHVQRLQSPTRPTTRRSTEVAFHFRIPVGVINVVGSSWVVFWAMPVRVYLIVSSCVVFWAMPVRVTGLVGDCFQLGGLFGNACSGCRLAQKSSSGSAVPFCR